MATEIEWSWKRAVNIEVSLGHGLILINNVFNVGSVLKILVTEKGKRHMYWNAITF